jgi:hypothetical protein
MSSRLKLMQDTIEHFQAGYIERIPEMVSEVEIIVRDGFAEMSRRVGGLELVALRVRQGLPDE